MDDSVVTVIPSDTKIPIAVSLYFSYFSTTLQNILTDQGCGSAIPLKYAKLLDVLLIEEFLKSYMNSIQINQELICCRSWERTLVEMDRTVLKNVTSAAGYLSIMPFLDVATAAVATVVYNENKKKKVI